MSNSGLGARATIASGGSKEKNKFFSNESQNQSFSTTSSSFHNDEFRLEVVDLFPIKQSTTSDEKKNDSSLTVKKIPVGTNFPGLLNASDERGQVPSIQQAKANVSQFFPTHQHQLPPQQPKSNQPTQNSHVNANSNHSTPVTDKDKDSVSCNNDPSSIETVSTHVPPATSEQEALENGNIIESVIATSFNKLSDNLEQIFAREFPLISKPFDGMMENSNEVREMCFEIQDEIERVNKKQRRALDIVGSLSDLVSNVAGERDAEELHPHQSE